MLAQKEDEPVERVTEVSILPFVARSAGLAMSVDLVTWGLRPRLYAFTCSAGCRALRIVG
jgi:hypothetical protein